MSFRKYNSIENSYREKYIEKACVNDFTLRRCQYIIQEKLHGANISFLFEKDQPPRVFSRNQELNWEHPKFYQLETYLKNEDFVIFLTGVQYKSDFFDMKIRLYGEFFGGNIQKGVNYGPNQRILFYDMIIEDQGYHSAYQFESFMSECDVNRFAWIVPCVGTYSSLNDALDVDIVRNTMAGVVEDSLGNIMEGVVIKPYFDFKVDHYGRPFYLKKKNEAFLEKSTACKPRIEKFIEPRIAELREEFSSYLNENRLDSVFSKLGPIEEPSQLGEYISAIHDDAYIDFMKDFGDEIQVLSKQDRKYVLGVTGKIVVPMLQKFM